jgi:dihydroorotate dehydrogenase
MHDALLRAADVIYALARPILFCVSAQRAHAGLLEALSGLDERAFAIAALDWLRKKTLPRSPLAVGGVLLEHPLIVAAGLVKGVGFADEQSALSAVSRGAPIMPGWRSVPALLGAVELGSFTRWPRPGNAGEVLWRDRATQSTQNRVGLKNPGARAAAAFLSRHRSQLPPVFGINIAVSPGVTEPQVERDEARESVELFRQSGVQPSWFTLNLSCPNTEDDPSGHQTEQRARKLCEGLAQSLGGVPLWVKLSPGLPVTQYAALARALAAAGARAVIATNTLAQPAPDGSGALAGVGGGRLHAPAVAAAAALTAEKKRLGLPIDIIGCGGVIDGATYRDFAALEIEAVQYWSALVYRGPLAAAQILRER